MIDIKPYQNNYQREICDLILSIQKDEFGIPITLDDQPDLLMIPDFYQINNGNFWMAVSGNKIIGTIALLDIGNNQAALRKMFVAADYRGKAFHAGQALLTELINWSKQKGIAEIFLGTTEKFIAAQRFYEKNGFTEIQKESLPPAFPVMKVDVKFYRYRF